MVGGGGIHLHLAGSINGLKHGRISLKQWISTNCKNSKRTGTHRSVVSVRQSLTKSLDG